MYSFNRCDMFFLCFFACYEIILCTLCFIIVINMSFIDMQLLVSCFYIDTVISLYCI